MFVQTTVRFAVCHNWLKFSSAEANAIAGDWDCSTTRCGSSPSGLPCRRSPCRFSRTKVREFVSRVAYPTTARATWASGKGVRRPVCPVCKKKKKDSNIIAWFRSTRPELCQRVVVQLCCHSAASERLIIMLTFARAALVAVLHFRRIVALCSMPLGALAFPRYARLRCSRCLRFITARRWECFLSVCVCVCALLGGYYPHHQWIF